MRTQKTNPVAKDPERLIGALLEISYLVGSVMRLDDILERIVSISAALMEVPVCSVYLLQQDKSLLMVSNIGFEPDLKGQASFPWGEGIPGSVARDGQMVALSDATADPRHKILPSKLALGCRACLCAPLRIQEEIIGVMSAQKNEVYTFSQEECKVFETICKQVAIVIEKARMYDEKIQAEQLAAVAVSLSEVAHYIKNVLFTTQIGERLINDGLVEGGDLQRARDGWRSLQEANAKIRKLVESILNYCRKTKLVFKPVNLGDMIAKIVKDIQSEAEKHNVRVISELDPSLTEVKLDQDSMYDALLNLATNGIDAIPEGRDGRLIIRTQRIHGQNNYKIELIDNGIGIPDEIKEKICNLFFSTKGKQGTGIGLAATKKVVEDHDGTLEFESTVGHGSRFIVFLPIWRPDEN
jgi:two-component system, NtrC family, sensor kinase